MGWTDSIKSTFWKAKRAPLLPSHKRRCSVVSSSPLFTKQFLLSIMLGFFFFLYTSGAMAKPVGRAIQVIRSEVGGLEVVHTGLKIKIAETILAGFSVTLVIVTYGFLIHRGSFMSTTSMYPRRSIERNIGSLLSLAWPRRSDSELGREMGQQKKSHPTGYFDSTSSKLSSIKLFYLGRMDADNHSGIVAKGLLDCGAKPNHKHSTSYRPRVWMTSGSHLTKSVVQLLVWEWVSFWLIGIMLFATLLYNGFLTNNLSADSYPRLVVTIIYALAYCFHFWYVWKICMRFFTRVAAGAAWSLLERAKFAICDSKGLDDHRKGSTFNFRGIDKASTEYVPLSFGAVFKHEVGLTDDIIDDTPLTGQDTPCGDTAEVDLKEVSAAIATLEAAQKTERITATESAATALDRVIANAMVMMSVTLASGFSSWTTTQVTTDSPNNFATTEVGSLALLASLSLGASTMFTSAMHLTILCSSFETILALKETKINGQAVDHYKKRQSGDQALSFSRGTVPSSKVGFFEILAANRFRDILSLCFLGPVFTLMPRREDHERTSKETDFDLNVRVKSGLDDDISESKVLFTTRGTDKHGRGKDGKNLEVINVCHIDDEEKEIIETVVNTMDEAKVFAQV